MAFDKPTRNRLQRFVSNARSLLTEEFTRQVQNDYGLDPASGHATPLKDLQHLDDARLETARVLRETVAHYTATGQHNSQDALERIVREQAFTVLNRLSALRMAEARGLLIESVAFGYESKGFQLYSKLAGSALGETGDAYRNYLFSIFDEFSLDLAMLFDRFSPQGRLFPREAALLDLLKLINDPDIAPLWSEDETIGWIYQYFNSKEERQKMREEAVGPPRNNRELAVRNQFFTPRYLVEFLIDNTLGRMWYEMTQGETDLPTLCHSLMRFPEERLSPPTIPLRTIKDPREIRLLDPACGSMHFGLYAFDLFERIYDEAWNWETKHGSHSITRSPEFEPLTEIYLDKDSLHRDVPRLIIEHNIHGIDIDPRAVQIAGLSLWLRAQKSWQSQQINPLHRPRNIRSNIVCAEEMPGETQFLQEFTSKLNHPALTCLLETTFQEMRKASEIGSLLRIEREIHEIISESKKARLHQAKQLALTTTGNILTTTTIDSEELSDEGFWEAAEERLYDSLREYAALTGNHVLQRRQFVDDTTLGFAFIDLCRKRYDVIVMNPPFGEASIDSFEYINKSYPTWNKNLLCAFIERTIGMLAPNGLMASVLDRTILNKSTYDQFRQNILLQNSRLRTVLDLGWEVLDANVEVSSCILGQSASSSPRAACIDLLEVDPDDKPAQLLKIIADANEFTKNVYVHNPSFFAQFPHSAIVYNLPDELLMTFSKFKSLTQRGFTGYTGHQLQAERHFRNYWEVPEAELDPSSDTYFLLYNGGEYSRFAYPHRELIWFGPFANLSPDTCPSYTYVFRNKEQHLKPGIAYGKRGEFLDAHALSEGFIFTVEGQLIPSIANPESLFVLALLNSAVASRLLNSYCGQHKYSGYVNLLPCPDLHGESFDNVVSQVSEAIAIKRFMFSFDETTLFFNGLFNENLLATGIRSLARRLYDEFDERTRRLNELTTSIESQLWNAYGITADETIHQLTLYAGRLPLETNPFTSSDEQSWNYEFAAMAMSFFVGVAFGRWDINKATKSFNPDILSNEYVDVPKLPPAANPPGSQKSAKQKLLNGAAPDILADDDGTSHDILAHVQHVLELLWPGESGKIEQDLCDMLRVDSLRIYLNKSNLFFADHFKRYTKSHRPAPIYWPISTASGSYTLWLYYQRLDNETLYTCVNDFVDPKLRILGEQIDQLRSKTNGSSSKNLQELQEFLSELRDFRDELLRLTKLPWTPALKDGVDICACPLAKLFLNKLWLKKLEEAWDSVKKGDCDWSHLSRTIASKRVNEKCQQDLWFAVAQDSAQLYKPQPEKKKSKRKPRNGEAAEQ